MALLGRRHESTEEEVVEENRDLGAEGHPHDRRGDRRDERQTERRREALRDRRKPDVAEPVEPSRKTTKPNVLIIVADDLGWFNVSAYHQGIMGGSTPNVDSIGRDGAVLTDGYAQASCTAGRAALITGQIPLRTGLTTVGLPAAPQGLYKEDPTLAELLKPLGYRTAQIGKNHLGDLNKYLPTVHGFDEFMGNLYHLNAQEEPEQPDYPQGEEFLNAFAPRGVLKAKATKRFDDTEDPRWGVVGKQEIEDLGPLTKKWMETVENDLLAASQDFIKRSVQADEPFFLWHNMTRMHVWTHLSERWNEKTGLGLYADGLQEMDWVVGELLQTLKDEGVDDNTIVIFTSDNGSESFSWPDGGTSPFRGEKGLGWEGGFRVPFVIKWPGVIPAGQLLTGIFSLEDIVPTIMSAAGVPDITEQLLAGTYKGGFEDTAYKVHLDGYDQLAYLKGEVDTSPRQAFFYFGESSLFAVRIQDWKVHFQTKDDWFHGQLVETTVPQPVNLKNDPFERHMEDPGYAKYSGEKLWLTMPAGAAVQKLAETFEDYPQRQSPANFNAQSMVDDVLAQTARRLGN